MADKATGESTALLRFEPGARFPAHNHPAGEELFVLEGDFRDGKHAASTERGCVILVTLPKPVEILGD